MPMLSWNLFSWGQADEVRVIHEKYMMEGLRQNISWFHVQGGIPLPVPW